MTRRSLLAGFAVLAGVASAAAAQVPSTDIFLAPLARTGADWSLGPAVNVTARAGYDNQPYFLPDGSGFLFTSIREDGQADTYRYTLATKAVTRVTTTPESEYSPTPIPDRAGWFSVVRVEADSAQRLWAFTLDGSGAELVVPDVQPVGYHAWIEGGGVAMFVLGEPSLRIVPALGQPAVRIAGGIGRSIVRVPGRRSVLFSQLHGGTYLVSRLDLPSNTIRPLVHTPRNDFFAWYDGALFSTDSSRVVAYRPGVDTSWRTIGNLTAQGIGGLTRIAVSGDGRWVAVVGRDQR